MNDIERLFEGDRPIPGMRPTTRRMAPTPPSSRGHEGSGHDGGGHAGGGHGDSADLVEEARVVDVAASAAADGGPAGRDRQAAPSGRDLALVEPGWLKPSRDLVYARDPGHAHSEQIRLLRTELLLRHPPTSEGSAIALLSPCAGEGRSLLAAELALSFAQLERATLLVDLDFRHPSLHRLFGCEASEGLAQALAAGRAPVVDRVEGFPSLAFVPAGACPPNALDLLMDWKFEKLIRDWRREYELIIVDTPPVTGYADALAVATVVGRVLLVNRARHTSYKAAREMLRRLSATDAQVVGSVLNHF
jgi:receptor protein-tyrosine kinase